MADAMMRVELEREEWDRIMAILAQAPWNVANPLLMKIGDQLRRQAEPPSGPVRWQDGADGSLPDEIEHGLGRRS